MYHKVPPETWLDKGFKTVNQGLQIYGTAKGLMEAASAIGGGLRSAYQVAGPVLAMM